MNQTLLVVVLVAEVKLNQNVTFLGLSALFLVQNCLESLFKVWIFALQVKEFGRNVVQVFVDAPVAEILESPIVLTIVKVREQTVLHEGIEENGKCYFLLARQEQPEDLQQSTVANQILDNESYIDSSDGIK